MVRSPRVRHILPIFEEPSHPGVQHIVRTTSENYSLPVYWRVKDGEYASPWSWGAKSTRVEDLHCSPSPPPHPHPNGRICTPPPFASIARGSSLWRQGGGVSLRRPTLAQVPSVRRSAAPNWTMISTYTRRGKASRCSELWPSPKLTQCKSIPEPDRVWKVSPCSKGSPKRKVLSTTLKVG